MQQRILFIIGALVLAALTAAGGFFYGTSVGEARANQIRQSFFQERFGGGAGLDSATGQSGQGRFGRPVVTGQVKSIDGKTIEISTANNVTRVTVDDKTQVMKFITGTLDDIKPGERVVVQGDAGTSGTVVARSIQLVPEGGRIQGGQ